MSLIFDAKKVMRCVKHALEAADWRADYDGLNRLPALHFVHDQGVYLMSNGLPADLTGPNDHCYVVYAQDCDPNQNDDFWETSRALVGGDDFVEIIPVDKEWLTKLAGHDAIRIDLTPEELSVAFVQLATASK
jgi:hypothetical protein